MIQKFYIALGLNLKHGFHDPKHALDIAPSWARAMNGEWSLLDVDLTDRKTAMRQAAEENRKKLAADFKEAPTSWWQVFESGPLEPGSFVLIEGLAADFHLDMSLTPVIATADEVAEFGALPVEPTVEPPAATKKAAKKRRKKAA